MEISVSTPDVVDSVTSVGNLVYHYAPLKAINAAKVAIVVSVDAMVTESMYDNAQYRFNTEVMFSREVLFAHVDKRFGLITDAAIQRKEEGKPKSHDVYATEFDAETEHV